jgi:serine/threonine protein kinase
MEYMEQGSLEDLLQKEGTLPVPDAVAVFREVALGVVNAHNRGVLHCDLKPANVLLGQDGKPRLADFGQARLSHEQTPALGTLFYMAPEQADLKAVPDARWDVYALGALLYCLLTGEPPYRDAPGVNVLEEPTSLEARLARYRQLLSQSKRPRKHRRVRGIDRGLVEIIDRALAIHPERRYPNVQALLNALDVRALRRARRPLLLLGVVGPILLLVLMAHLLRSELSLAVRKSTELLTEETRISNEFAAQAVAAKIAGKIDRRWRTLEQEAADADFQRLLTAARGKALGTPEQSSLQHWLDRLVRTHPEVSASSWAVLDDMGTLLARSPHSKRIDREFIGQRFPHRNFFHGQDRDLDPKTPPPPPLIRVHRSSVFESNLTGTRMVAFSVPVWKGKPAMPTQPRLGVLVMTVEVGGFVELSPREGMSEDYLAILVDRRPDVQGRKGAILEHPRLAELRKEKKPEKDLQFFLDPERFRERSWDPDYVDPLGAVYPKYAGRWLAASHPVLIDERPEVRETGWVVVVQERYDTAIGPVDQLEKDMMVRGWTALGLAVTGVTLLWLFVVVVLNESTGSRLFRYLKRRAGLVSDGVRSAKPSSQRGRTDQHPEDPVPTVLEPNRAMPDK